VARVVQEWGQIVIAAGIVTDVQDLEPRRVECEYEKPMNTSSDPLTAEAALLLLEVEA
jgi:hypothetical protein